MKRRALIREIWRDIVTGTAWTVTLTMLASVLMTGVAATDMLMVSRLNLQAEHFRMVMANVQVIEAPDKVDPAACTALSSLPGVHAAAAVRSPEHQVGANALPSSNIRTYEATPGIENILRVPASERPSTHQVPGQMGVYLSQTVAQTLGAQTGTTVRLDDQDVHVMGIFPWSEEDGRRPGFAYSVFAPAPVHGFFDECWVDTWPMNPDLTPYIRGVVLGSDDPTQQMKLYAFNSTLGSNFNGPSLLHHRMTAWTPFIVAGIGLIVGAVSVWRRRLEMSSDLHAGVRRQDLLAKIMWETAAWVGATLILALPVMMWIILRNPGHDQAAMWVLAAIHLSVGAGGSLLGAFGAALSVREKHLLRYFKHR